jgi:hypothetical protein
MEVIIGGIYVLGTALLWYRNRRRVRFGVLSGPNGTKYAYALGNYLASETATFHGIDITLPAPLTNLYLDSHKDSHRRGPGQLFDAKQKLALEGNFGRYFQLFVPQGTEVQALSIISPDVMQTLINASGRYDVELYDDHLRLISLNKVYGEPAFETDILEAAQAVLAQIAERQRSWQPSEQPLPQLSYRKGGTFKVRSLYVRRSRIFLTIGLLLAAVVIAGFSLSGYYTYHDPHFNDPYSKGFVEGTLMYAAAVIFISAIPVSLLGTLIWLVSYRSVPDSWPKKPRK